LTFLIYALLGAAGVYVANKKGYKEWWTVVLIFLLGMFGLVIILFLPKKKVPGELRTSLGIESALIGTTVSSGHQIGYKVVQAHVIDGTIREYDRQVYADVDLVLSDGEMRRATFEAVGSRFVTRWSDS
jgi:hypothetical protein